MFNAKQVRQLEIDNARLQERAEGLERENAELKKQLGLYREAEAQQREQEKLLAGQFSNLMGYGGQFMGANNDNKN